MHIQSLLHVLLLFYYWWGGTKSLGTAATSGLVYKLQMIDEDDCGAIDGMKIGRGNRSTRRKPAPAPLCPPQIPYDQTLAPTPGRRGGKPATNGLSYGAALLPHVTRNASESINEIFRSEKSWLWVKIPSPDHKNRSFNHHSVVGWNILTL
jgi:hypothetical protein